jgi:PBP4 family serine-type D-alanyl-D-alanine carboxypeptidase
VKTAIGPTLSFRFSLWFALTFSTLAPIGAQSNMPLSDRVQKVVSRAEFAHANFGIEFYSVDTGRVIYALNEQKLFVPASTTKLLTEGTVLASLGADFKFVTRIYRTGPVDSKGRLKGDLVLVASGDPNLSNRIQPDGTLAFGNNDHSYSGAALLGDPLTVIRQLAKSVATKGIRQIEGRVLVDASLFPETSWEGEGGGGLVISPIAVNDNLIDLVLTPAAKIGDPVVLNSAPQTSYVKFINHLMTASAKTSVSLDPPEIKANTDGTIIATLKGTLPLGAPRTFAPFFVPSPAVFAETVLREALEEVGVRVKVAMSTPAPDFQPYRRFYSPDDEVAEHVSLPLAEEIKVTLKVSQNLHAFMGPYLLGALLAKDTKDAFQDGFAVERKFLLDAKLDLSGVSQGDGAGGSWADLFTPDFMCHYLAYWTTRPDYSSFFRGLPILGRDGTLAEVIPTSPAAGHIFAKTGTFDSEDMLDEMPMLNGKGLAGYVIRADGKRIAFAAYVNHVHMSLGPEAATHALADALGEISAAAYDAPLDDVVSEERH